MARGWADGLVSEGATVVAKYDHPHFGQFPAVTVHSFGAGRVSYIGTLPNPSLGRWIAEVVLSSVPCRPIWNDLPASVRANSARTRPGSRLWFVGNWSWSPVEVAVPVKVDELGTGVELMTGDILRLGAWDVRLLLEKREQVER